MKGKRERIFISLCITRNSGLASPLPEEGNILLKRLSFRRLTEPVRKAQTSSTTQRGKEMGTVHQSVPSPLIHLPHTLQHWFQVKVSTSKFLDPSIPKAAATSGQSEPTSRAPTLPPSMGGQGCYFSSLACSLFRRSIFFCSFLFTCSCFFSCSVCWTFSRNLLFFFLILASSAFLFSSRSGSCNSKCQDT